MERLNALDSTIHTCIEVSQRFSGIPAPTGRHFYASVLFTSLCTRGVSLAIIAPHSSWAQRLVEHWDYASIAGITRSMLEVRLAFFYLCAENCSLDEWECRWDLFNLHDCKSRIKLFEAIGTGVEDISGLENQADELRLRLSKNQFFINLPEKQRKQLINGDKAYLYPLEDIASAAGVEKQTFRWLYRFLSTQVHGLPMSFYRMGDQERGRGIYSSVEEGYTSLCLSFCVSLLVSSREEMEHLFEGSKMNT